jgi:hypothetical protein
MQGKPLVAFDPSAVWSELASETSTYEKGIVRLSEKVGPNQRLNQYSYVIMLQILKRHDY